MTTLAPSKAHAAALFTVTLPTILAAGCLDPSYPNRPLRKYDPAAGYRFHALEPSDQNTDDVFVCLTFSGGGTRAAALAYGVLLELRDTPIPPLGPEGQPRRLLDEVDMISSVSGGSFTAVGHALWRDHLFDGEFERGFLKANIHSVLWRLLWNPRNLLRLPFVMLDRIDVAATYYTEEIFDNATYADLIELGLRPMVVVNATNLALGHRFEFTQRDFDLLGSDLSSVPLGWSVAASSAFPILLSPLRLKYYPQPEGSTVFEDIITDPLARETDRRRYFWAQSLIPLRRADEPPQYVLDEDSHRFLYLLDGGLADNLGLAPVIELLRHGFIHRKIHEQRIKYLVVIVVDAGTKPPEKTERLPTAPGIFKVGYKTATTSMQNYSEMLKLIIEYLMSEEPANRRYATVLYRELTACRPDTSIPPPPPDDKVERYLVNIAFNSIEDESQRRRFLSLPTSFYLRNRDVDDLIETGRTLLRADPSFQQLLRNLDGGRQREVWP